MRFFFRVAEQAVSKNSLKGRCPWLLLWLRVELGESFHTWEEFGWFEFPHGEEVSGLFPGLGQREMGMVET